MQGGRPGQEGARVLFPGRRGVPRGKQAKRGSFLLGGPPPSAHALLGLETSVRGVPPLVSARLPDSKLWEELGGVGHLSGEKKSLGSGRGCAKRVRPRSCLSFFPPGLL